MSDGPVVHIGFPKAASSFLQKMIFPQIVGYEYIRDRAQVRDLSKRYWFEYEDDIRRNLDLDANLIISREHLTSPAYSMLKSENYEHRGMAIANLIHFFKARGTIVIVLRRQDTLVESLVRYKSSFFHSGRAPFLDFFAKDPWPRLRSMSGDMLLQSYDFCTLVSQLAGALGEDRVKLLLYEDLVHDPEVFLTRLGEIFGQDLSHFLEQTRTRINASAGTTRLGSPLSLALNSRFSGRLERMLPKQEVRLSDNMRNRLLEIFAPGNEKLFHWLGLENRYGYF